MSQITMKPSDWAAMSQEQLTRLRKKFRTEKRNRMKQLIKPIEKQHLDPIREQYIKPLKDLHITPINDILKEIGRHITKRKMEKCYIVIGGTRSGPFLRKDIEAMIVKENAPVPSGPRDPQSIIRDDIQSHGGSLPLSI